ncbi:MAG: agmatine deiminase family protein [Bacteroidota bacterium]
MVRNFFREGIQSRGYSGAVLAAKYWKPGLPEALKKTDQQAAEVLQELFPNREIIQMDAITINWHGGGIHCITQQEPKKAL